MIGDIMKLAVIGCGYVGETVYKALKVESKLSIPKRVNVLRVDPPKGFHTEYSELVDCDAVFICVPSPQDEDGSADTSILESVLDNLKKVNYENLIISKVTAPPDVYKRLHLTNPNLVHVPEFLTAYNAFYDYVMNPVIIIGGDGIWADKADRIVRLSKSDPKETMFCSIVDAAVIKYAINSFLAMKVIFFNELKTLSDNCGASWHKVRKGVTTDLRISESHSFVPGSDGQYGFGGMCFPKDTSAFLHFADSLGIDLAVIRSAVEKNQEIKFQAEIQKII